MFQTPPTRFPGGLSTAIKNTLFGNLTIPNPLQPHTYVNDFNDYTAAQWVVTTAGAGATALAAGNGGFVTQTTNGGGTDAQFNLKTPASFAFVAGTQLWFAWRGKLSTLSSILQVGLQVAGSSFAPTDGVYFTKATGVGTVNAVIRAASTSTTIAAITTMAVDTYITLGFYYDGQTTPTLYFFSSADSPSLSAFGQPFFTGGNMVTAVGALNPTNSSLANLPTANLALGFGITEGAAAAEVMTSDYIMAANEILRY